MLTRREFLAYLGILGAAVVLPVKIVENEREIKKAQAAKPVDCDWVIENVFLIDGSGNPGFPGKLAVKDDKIVAIGDFLVSETVEVIAGHGYILAPGFIDVHTHTEDYFLSGGEMSPFLSQGVTLQIGGNCGRSPRDLKDFFQRVPEMQINYGSLMGYATLRQMVWGRDCPEKASLQEINQMQNYLAKALEDGAVGLSIGLEYWPQTYASTEEVIALCEVLKEKGGFYATHIRSEYDRVLEALEEAIEIGFQAGVPVQYSHLKAGFKRNWSKVPRILEMLSEAEADGLDIRADFYGYTYSSTDVGRKVFQHSMSAENLELAAVHPLTFFASDAGIHAGGRAIHPRAYGNIPRILRWFVREKGLLTWEKAIAKLTSQPARRLNLKRRGLLKEGYQADLVLFDPETITDKATREKTNIFSEGVKKVWVNGKLAWADGESLHPNSGQKILNKKLVV